MQDKSLRTGFYNNSENNNNKNNKPGTLSASILAEENE